ncbi:radical SAM protein [Olsenella sp. HMSC062G07]|uniref:radical SAM protein n=1 Tax=Olsenella sp. HMSC062G07 TaxID=1739330 RepID=UPI000AF84C75|nr:radical SAM protein [Olsenella sp. HMSC062G07]
MTAPRVAYVNLGCRVNRDELDDIARTLAAEGVAVVDPPDASVIVVNSCAVTGEAQATTRKRVRHLAALPQAPEVVVTGCVASLFADELASVAPSVRVVPDKAQVAAQVMSVVGISALPHESAAPRPGTPTGRTRPGIKIQDGCDHRCSYCIVWRARGAQRSLPAADVLERVARESERGAAEVVLSGINLGSYQDRGLDLAGLLAMLMRETDVRRVRA